MRSMAEDILRNRIGDKRANLGINWPDRFLTRHPELKTTWSEALANSRAAAASPTNIKRWLEKLWQQCDDENIRPEVIWNFDEKGIQAGGIHRQKIVVRKSYICFDRQRRGPGDKENLTLIECCSAAGAVCPPLIIMQGKETQLGWAKSEIVSNSKFYIDLSFMLIFI